MVSLIMTRWVNLKASNPMLSIDIVLLTASALLLVSILTSKALGKYGIPSLLLFLLVGMLAGSDGPGGIYFDNPWLAQLLGVIALILILFSGGMDTEWRRVRPVLGWGIALATIGVFLTTAAFGIFARFVLDYSWLESFLLGAIVSSTDAAAVFAVLRARNVALSNRTKYLLELESGSNDPMAVFLTIGFTLMLVDPTVSVANLSGKFAMQMTLGTCIGLLMGTGIVALVNRLRLEYQGLYPVLTLSMVGLTYAVASLLGGNGFLAVYLAGLMTGSRRFIHKPSLMRFHDGLAWLMQIAMFLTLGLLVFPTRLVPIMGTGIILSLFLIFIARPLSVHLTLFKAPMPFREKSLIAWTGLRGAVPIILATFPLLAGVPKADEMFNIVFFIVLTSVLLQGPSISWAARRLGVADDAEPDESTEIVSNQLLPDDRYVEVFSVQPGAFAIDKQIVDLPLPGDTLLILIKRDERFLIPEGMTVLKAGDEVSALVSRESRPKVSAVMKGDLPSASFNATKG